MYCYIVHVDHDVSLIDEVVEYSVYHCLEGGWGVGEAKEHHCWFVKSFIGDKCCFPPIFLFNEDFIISPLDIKPRKDGAPSELVNQLRDKR